MSKQVIEEMATATERGQMTFPQVVGRLVEVGVESYLVRSRLGSRSMTFVPVRPSEFS